jgi:menaquinol-cytochrome c reductase iron-sulfur subunit
MNRRKFLAAIVQTFSVGITALLSLPVVQFLKSAVAEEGRGTWINLLSMDSLQSSEDVRLISFSRVVRDGWLTKTVQDFVWVCKQTDEKVIVFDPHCTHLGCAVAWNSQAGDFECPCHGGRFDKNGNRTAGPPPRPLDRYETKIVGDTLKIGPLLKNT